MSETFTILNIKLILDNVLFIMAVLYTAWRKDYPHATILALTALVSGTYHLCQVGYYCAHFSFEAYKTEDHFIVYCCIFWTMLSITSLQIETRTCIWFVLSFMMYPFTFVQEDEFAGPIFIAITLIIVIISVYIKRRQRQIWHVYNIIALMICASAGIPLYFYGGNIGDFVYTWTHGIWHDLAAISALFIVDIKRGTIIRGMVSRITSRTLIVTSSFYRYSSVFSLRFTSWNHDLENQLDNHLSNVNRERRQVRPNKKETKPAPQKQRESPCVSPQPQKKGSITASWKSK